MSGPAAFRCLRAVDAPACAQLHAQAFAASWSAEDFRDQIARADRLSNAAICREPTLAGFAISRFVAGEADLLTIVVERSWRKTGIGGHLLAHHLSALTARGINTVFLEVGEGNAAARALYARFGFTSVGHRKAYYANNANAASGPSNAILLRRAL